MSTYSIVVALFLGYFSQIDYSAEIIKKLFLKKRTDTEFYEEYIDSASRKTGKDGKGCCAKKVLPNPNDFNKYLLTKKEEEEKVVENLNDKRVSLIDIRYMIFDIFATRKKFVYDGKELFYMYFSLFGNFFLLSCCCTKKMIHNLKVFKNA